MSELYKTTPFRIPEDRIQIKTGKSIENGIYYWEDMYPDSHVFADGEYLRRTYAPDFLLIHTMCIDYMGHKYGADSQQYETAVAMVGHELASYVPIWRKEGYNIVITADHGMNQFGIHGGTGTAQRDTPLYIFSEKIETGDFSGNYIDQLCIAPLLCSLMGLDPSEEMVKDIPIRFHG